MRCYDCAALSQCQRVLPRLAGAGATPHKRANGGFGAHPVGVGAVADGGQQLPGDLDHAAPSATGLKFSERTHLGTAHLATSLVADLQLITAALVWGSAVRLAADGYTPASATIMESMSVGALFANVVSVFLLVVETVSFVPR